MTGKALPIVSLRHARMIRRAGGRPLCLDGIKAWCDATGIDWAAFSGDGVPGEVLAAAGGPWAMKAIEHAQRERTDG